MFVRKPESFICEQCGTQVEGNGYTNHCPECFVSKHVDVDPGDRAAECGGRMPTIHVEMHHGEFVLTQQCELCGHTRKNKAQTIDNQTIDNIDALIQLQKQLVQQTALHLE